MDSYAYDHNLPCLNPNCKSHGRPHANCKCYSHMAEGGSAHFCSEARMHDKSCEYYADGGEVEIPADQVTPDQSPSEEIDPNQVTLDTEPQESQSSQSGIDYTSPEQQAKTIMEGLGRGIVPGLSTAVETKVLGVNPQDIEARKETNPWEAGLSEAGATAGSLMTGLGEVGLISRAIPEVTVLGKVGSAVLKGAIESGLIQGGDEISNSMLGKGDPEAPVSSALAHMGAAALLGGVTGGVFNILGQGATKGLQAIENAKIGSKADAIRTGLGIASKAHAEGVAEDEIENYVAKQFGKTAGNLKPSSLREVPLKSDIKAITEGAKLYYNGLGKITDAIAEGAGTVAGGSVAGIPGAVIGDRMSKKYLAPIVQKILNRPLIGLNKLVMPMVLNAMSKDETSGLLDLVDYATKADRGAKAINKGIESVFKAGGAQAVEAYADERNKDKIRQFINDGGVTKQIDNQLNQQSQTPQVAEGGKVETQPDQSEGTFARLYPEQNTMLNSAKARVSTYLNSIRPQKTPGLPFDGHHEDKHAERVYDRALDIADKPLSVLNHIKSGELNLEHIKHLNGMYPELMGHLQKKITQRLTEAQVQEEKPPFRTRQALSLFLATPLESSHTPASIQAAQAIFLSSPQQSPQQANPGKTKRGTSTLGKSNKTYQTSDQAAESDRSSR